MQTVPRYRARTRIRFGDVDYAQILYYPRFFDLFHRAFEDFFNEYLELSYDDALGRDRVGFPSVHAEADFFRPVRFGDRVEIEVGIERIGEKSVCFVYWLRREGEDEICARGRVTVATIDLDTFAPVSVPPRYREHFARYLKQTGSAGLIAPLDRA